MKKTMDVSLNYNPDEIKKLEQKCSYFLKHQGYSDDTIQTQIMILRKLITSSKNFNDLRTSELQMSVQLHIKKDTITLEVKKSICESNCDKLKDLDKTIQWIRGNRDPLEHYMINFSEAFDISHIAETNGFGLAGIAHQTDAAIDFYVSEDSVLNLSAVCNLTAAKLS